MATSSNYYIDTATFATATAVFVNQNLSVLAPDGIYSFGSTTRQQSGGVLQAAVTCPACAIPFSSTIVQTTSNFACAALQDQTYYALTATITTGSAVYSNSNTTTALPNGFYTSDNLTGGGWFQVTSGVISAVGNCPPPAPVCNDRRVVFQICNSNSVIDDNFDIYLNNIYIGAVDLNANAQVGSVFIADLNPAITIGSADFECPLTLMVTYRFDPSILLSVNTLEMRNTQNNGLDNAGSIGVRNYLLTGTTLATPCVITDLTFEGLSGTSFTFNFSYTQCCPFEPTSYAFSGQSGTVTCVDGETGFISSGPITLYASVSVLAVDVELYTDALLTTLTTIDGFRAGIAIYSITSGAIDIVSSTNSPC
jgi:hypothetical protein